MTGKATGKKPNPQGKGQVALLNDWQQFRPSTSAAKSLHQALADYVTSMLVLSSNFRFKPTVGQDYYLYCRDGEWHLSLIEPHRWSKARSGDCLGACQLHPDMTWSIRPCEQTAATAAALEHFIHQLDAHLQSTHTNLPLPFYEKHLGYYCRLAATGFASSLTQSAPDFSQQLSKHLQHSRPAELLAHSFRHSS